MFFTAAALGLALAAAPTAAPAAAPAAATCTRYRVMAEKNDLAAEEDVAAWATAALERGALLDKASPCFVHVRITASPIRAGGREDGWVAHVSVSTRRYFKDGKLVTNEKGILLVEPTREALAAKARTHVEEFVSRLR